MKLSTLVITTFIGSTTATVFADDAVAPPPSVTSSSEKEDPANSINVSPLGVVFGNYALTYERLFAGHHGVIVEGIFSRSTGDEGDSMQYGGAIGYRWHWRGRQNSGFLGVTFAQSIGTGEVTTNGMSYDMSVRSTMITANIGKRWLFGPINVTTRFGLGWGHHVASADSDTQEAKDAEELMNDILSFLPIGVEGELSVGYTF